jgi:hypothetical protein
VLNNLKLQTIMNTVDIISGSDSTEPTAAEIQKATDEKMARDQRIARQKKLAELAKEKNSGASVVQNSTNPRGRRPARIHHGQRHAPRLEASKPIKKHDAKAAREHAAAELKKHTEAKEEAEREAKLKAKLLRLQQTLRAKVDAGSDGDSDVDISDILSILDWQSDDDDLDPTPTADHTHDTVSSGTPQFKYDYGVIIEKNETAMHRSIEVDASPAPAHEAAVSTANEDEATLLVDTSAVVEQLDGSYVDVVEVNEGTVHSQYTVIITKEELFIITKEELFIITKEELAPILAFGPAPAIEAEACTANEDEAPLLVQAAVVSEHEPILAFGPTPTMETEAPAIDEEDNCLAHTHTPTDLEKISDDGALATTEQFESLVADGTVVSTPITEDVSAPQESTDLPEPVEDERSTEAIADDGSDLGSIGFSSIESFDAVGVSDVPGTLKEIFGHITKALEYEVQSETAPVKDSLEAVSSQALIEIVEPVTEEEPVVAVTPVDNVQTPDIALLEQQSKIVTEQIEVDVAVDHTAVTSPRYRRSSNRSSHTAVSVESKTASRQSSARSDRSTRKHIDSEAHIAKTTYLGVTSLAVFVTKVAFERDGTTTKTDVCKAFAALSAADTKGLTGQHPTQVYTEFESPRTQRRLKLGDTTLYGFLKQIDFYNDNMTTITDVMRAFREAAKEDDFPSDKLVLALQLEAASDYGATPRSRRSSVRAVPLKQTPTRLLRF